MGFWIVDFRFLILDCSARERASASGEGDGRHAARARDFVHHTTHFFD